MCTRNGRIGLTVFCMLFVALCWQAPALAASAPPTINDIVGTYAVTDKEVYYYFDDTTAYKDYYALTWRISKTSELTVDVYVEEWDWSFQAYYKNGYLVQSLRDTEGVGVGIALFSGKTGKVKFKGDFGWGQFGGVDEYVEWDPYNGKMLSTDPGFVVGSAEAASLQQEKVVLSATPLPLGIDDLLGTYSCTLTGTMYHPTAGTKEKGKLQDIVTITKVDDVTLNIHIDTLGWDMQAHYGGGVLLIADADSGLDANARFAIFLAKGKPGKISLKGKMYSIMDLGTIDDEFEVASVSCKQSSP